MKAEMIERVLLAVAQIPDGCVATYGDVGHLAGVGPRQVGAIMAAHAHGAPWWRVVNASGTLPPHLIAEAQQQWDAEGIRHRAGRVDLGVHRIEV